MIGFSGAGVALERQVRAASLDRELESLSRLAMGNEPWDCSERGKHGHLFILRQYIKYTFYKAWLDGLVLENDSGEAVFNTGLVDNTYDSIFCYLRKNTDPGFLDRPWEVAYFTCWGKGQRGKEINRRFAFRPQAPRYIDVGKLEGIFFNTARELSCDYDHILKDNLNRVPLEFIEHELAYDAHIRELVEAYEKSRKKAIGML